VVRAHGERLLELVLANVDREHLGARVARDLARGEPEAARADDRDSLA
jgi:hypothetical protein